MKRKRIVKTISISIFVLLLISFVSVGYANSGGNTSGGDAGKKYGNCGGNGCDWTIPYSSFDLRFSLYQFDGSTLIYYGSVDYCTEDGCTADLGWKAYQNKSAAGKIAYQENKATYNEFLTREITVNRNHTFKAYTGQYCSGCTYENSGIIDEIKSFFKLSSQNSRQVILQRLKEEFGASISSLNVGNLSNVYLTVEPTFAITNASTGEHQYGTAYEIARFFENGMSAGAVNYIVYNDAAVSIMAERATSNDPNGFVGKKIKLLQNGSNLNRSAAYWQDSDRSQMAKSITSLDGYGINVFWLGEYVKKDENPYCEITTSDDVNYHLSWGNITPSQYGISNDKSYPTNGKTDYTAKASDTNVYGVVTYANGKITCQRSREAIPETCPSTCAGKTGDDLLACSENYCERHSSNSNEKRTCMIECNAKDPNMPSYENFTSCDKVSSSNAAYTVCSAQTSANKQTCEPATTKTYFKTVCTEQSTLSYGDSLPTTIIPGQGISYTSTLHGNKNCVMTFEVNKWKFDYAARLANDRSDLLEILRRFQSYDDNSEWAKNDKYKYDSSNADINITIDTDNEEKSITKKLEASKTVNLLNKEIQVKVGSTVSVPLFANGNVRNESIYRMISTDSSNKTIYRLPPTCIDGASGKIYDPNSEGNCNKSNDGPYYQLFTDITLKDGTYNTKVTVTKESSNFDANNTCDYNVNKKGGLSCAVIGSNGKYELIINNKYGEDITYGLSTNRGTINNNTELYVGNNVKNYTVWGTVKSNKKTIECSLGVNDTPSDSSKDTTCRLLYKPAEYDKIRDYCSVHWADDTDNYTSETNCYNTCTNPPINDNPNDPYDPNNPDDNNNSTCKVNKEFACYELDKVKDYCKINFQKDGYKTESSCINDCSCSQPGKPNDNDNNDNDDNAVCFGVLCDYLYRPISLKDPFPKNRIPGYNWYGREVYITDDLLNPALNSSATPEYVIELTPNRIKTIRGNTKKYNLGKGKNAYIDYVYKNEYVTNGKYESKFIHVNDENDGGFYSYFEYINGTKVG